VSFEIWPKIELKKPTYEKGKPYALAFPDESHEIGEKKEV